MKNSIASYALYFLVGVSCVYTGALVARGDHQRLSVLTNEKFL